GAVITVAKARPSGEPSRRERLDAAVRRTAKAEGRKVTTTKEDTMLDTFSKAAADAATTLVEIAKAERGRQAQLGNDVTMEQATAIARREAPHAKAAPRTLRDE